MTFTLTYGGEHFVVDAVVGWLYAAAAVSGTAWVFRRRDVPRAHPPVVRSVSARAGDRGQAAGT